MLNSLRGLFNAKAIFVEELHCYYLTYSWEDTSVHTYPQGISPKVNVIERLEFELGKFEAIIQHFSH